MKAVQKFFDDRHDVFVRFGGLIAFIFLVIFVPTYEISKVQTELQKQVEINQQLSEELDNYKTSLHNLQIVNKEINCLAKNIYFEAGNESVQGKLAVAQVTMNRVDHGFAKDVCGVVNQKIGKTCQFSWTCTKNRIRNWVQFDAAKKIAQDIIIGKKKTKVVDRNVLYYHADYIDPQWNREQVATIGRHIFYH